MLILTGEALKGVFLVRVAFELLSRNIQLRLGGKKCVQG